MLDVSAPRAIPVGRSMSRYKSRLYFKELLFPLLPSFTVFRFSSFHVPWSQLLSLSFYSLPDLLYSRVGYSCVQRVQREVCVIGRAGKGTFIERPPFLVLHRFTCYVRSWIPGSPSVPLSAPPHRTLVDFSSEVPLFERVGRVLRWPWRKPVAVAVSFRKELISCHASMLNIPTECNIASVQFCLDIKFLV